VERTTLILRTGFLSKSKKCIFTPEKLTPEIFQAISVSCSAGNIFSYEPNVRPTGDGRRINQKE
jgi:hypothetical protein